MIGNKEDLFNIMQEEYNYLVSKYGEDRILGVFAYGEANYGVLEEFEIKFTSVYLPTFKEICTNLIPKNEDIRNSHFVDIRLATDAASVQSNYFIESILTEHYILNPRYENLFKEHLKQNNSILCELNPSKRIEFSAAAGLEALDNKDYYTAARLKAAIEFYIDGVDCYKCIHISKMPYVKPYLEGVYMGKNEIDVEELTLFFHKNFFRNNLDGINPKAQKILNEGIFEIMSLAIQDSVKKEKFFNSLTNKEKEALKTILSKIKDEGYLSISALVTETKLSRPVFNNVLMKLDNFKIAEIDNKGAKGTHVKFIEKIRM